MGESSNWIEEQLEAFNEVASKYVIKD